jgi:hypothetical protein
MAQYDPAILQKFADKMYSSAVVIIVVGIVFGALLGGGMGAGVANAGSKAGSSMTPAIVGMVVGAGFGGLLGYLAGFWYRFRAQVVLCQLQIEMNTRPHGQAGQQPYSVQQPYGMR